MRITKIRPGDYEASHDGHSYQIWRYKGDDGRPRWRVNRDDEIDFADCDTFRKAKAAIGPDEADDVQRTSDRHREKPLRVRLPEAQRQRLMKRVERTGEPVNRFITEAVREKLDREAGRADGTERRA